MKRKNYSIMDFKNEFRFICTDTWGDAVEAWFESVGRLHIRGVLIPDKYEYRPGLLPCDRDSYFYSTFRDCKTGDLRLLSEYLFRYCQYLRYKGIDY